MFQLIVVVFLRGGNMNKNVFLDEGYGLITWLPCIQNVVKAFFNSLFLNSSFSE